MSKAAGGKIVIQFTENLTGDITGRDAAVGGWKIGEDRAAAGTASAGSTRSTPTYSADKAIDRNNTTSWQPAYQILSWHRVDLGAQYQIKGFALRTPAADGYPTGYRVEASNDAVNWTIIHTGTNPAGYGVTQTVTFPAVHDYRYWQIVVTARSGNYPGLAEVYYYERAPIGNEAAFTITGQEPFWTNIHDEEPGDLVVGDYIVAAVDQTDPPDLKKILLTMEDLKRFNGVEGNLTVSYDAALGSLAGAGGIVASFEQDFTPADLERFIKPYYPESMKAAISEFASTLSRIYHQVMGDGPNPATHDESIKPVREYDAGPPEVLEQEKGVCGDDGNESIEASITALSITLTYTGGIDP